MHHARPMSDSIPNVLAERYATAPMRALWSPEGKVRLERDYWIAVLKGQRDLGISVPDGVIETIPQPVARIVKLPTP